MFKWYGERVCMSCLQRLKEMVNVVVKENPQFKHKTDPEIAKIDAVIEEIQTKSKKRAAKRNK